MSDPPRRRDSDKSRQELLDEIYLLRDIAGERDQQNRELLARIADKDSAYAELQAWRGRVLSSRSWRLTAPLRWVTRRLAGARAAAPGRVAPSIPDEASSPPRRSTPATVDHGQPTSSANEDRSDGVSRLYVDITELALRHGRTGVQRVTREILRALLDCPPEGFRVQPVCALPGQPYRCLRVAGNARIASVLTPGEGARPHGGEPLITPDSRHSGESLSLSAEIGGGNPAPSLRSSELQTHWIPGSVAMKPRRPRNDEQNESFPASPPPPGEGGRNKLASPPPPGEGGRRPGGGTHTRDAHSEHHATISDSLKLQPMAGDTFLGLDHAMDAVVANADQLSAMHDSGVHMWFVCNDVLPLEHPEWFPPDVAPKFRSWLETIARVGDGIACISRATESALRTQLDVMQTHRDQPITVSHFGLGADPAPGGDAAITPDQAALLDQIRNRPSFLMVGTLEPRKGHAQALEAFNQLWTSGENVALVIAGFPGWMTEVTQRRIRHHDEFGQRLFWFMDADDALLDALYRSCTALLAPSEGEGFGLPLVEAARHGLPILCRDLPVFREVAGERATYFTGLDSDSLASAVRSWLNDLSHGAIPTSSDMQALSWAESAHQLSDLFGRQR